MLGIIDLVYVVVCVCERERDQWFLFVLGLKCVGSWNKRERRGEGLKSVVGELAKLLQVHYDKFWLMGATASYDNYLNLVGKFPSIEKDWDLQLLPITLIC